MSRLTELLRRAKTILQTEGVIPLVRRGFSFVLWCSVRYRTYCLYKLAAEDIRKLNEADFMPKVDNYTLKIVSTNEEADELEKEDLEFRSQSVNSRKKLDKGAVALCIFVGQELAHLNWIAMTEDARKSLGEHPMKVDFANSEVYTGNTWTHPNYRRMGFSTYRHFKMVQFLEERGKVKHRVSVRKNNIVAQRVATKCGWKVYAEGRYLNILWWKSWKEKPLT